MNREWLKKQLELKEPEDILRKIIYFVREEFEKFGFKKAVIGISGGIDSALSAFIGSQALGKENIIGISMPYKTSAKESIEDARLVAQTLGINFIEIDITPQIDAYFSRFPEANKLRYGNKMARERMSILYDMAHKEGALVLGTSNKSEILVGYATRWGDMAVDINPIGDLYKTQVWQLARYTSIPEKIIKKKPTADLWPGQTDENELGITYEILDQILYAYVDLRLSLEDIVNLGFDKNTVEKVIEKVKSSQYKRKLPIICKISQRTPDKNLLYFRDWGR